MKKIYLSVMLALSLVVNAQNNCNVGTFDLTADYGNNLNPTAAYHFGNLINVSTPGTATSLNYYSPIAGIPFKMYLYKKIDNLLGEFIVSTALTTSVVGANTLPIAETNLEVGDYLVFINYDQNTSIYYNRNNSTTATYEFSGSNADSALQQIRLVSFYNFELMLGITINCDTTQTNCNQSNQSDLSLLGDIHSGYNQVLSSKFTISEEKTLTALKYYFGTFAEGNFKMYIQSSVNGKPGAVLASTGIIPAQSGINNHDLTDYLALAPGDYFFSIMIESYLDHLVGSHTNNNSNYWYDTEFNLEPSDDQTMYFQDNNFLFPYELVMSCGTLSSNDFNSLTLSVYPNPAQDQLFISGLKEATAYTVFNVLGAKIGTGTINEQNSIPVSHLAKGMYVIKLDGGQTLKFIKD